MAPRKKPLKATWIVLSNGQLVEVVAEEIVIPASATLVFTTSGEIVRAFAHGAWSTVELPQGEQL